jgi:uncharacterized RDD family membrane protein YckC
MADQRPLRDSPDPAKPAEPPAAGAESNGSLAALVEATGKAGAAAARAGWRGTQEVARRLGVDRAIGRALDRDADRATEGSPAEPAARPAERATERVLESDTAKRVWGKVLESDEAQKLVERVAEAPEVRAAITAQGVGLLEDLRRGVRRFARRLDDGIERGARTLLRRSFHPGQPVRTERPIYAGVATRALALALDAAVVYGGLLIVSAAIALLISAFSSGDQNAGNVVIAVGAFVWFLIAGTYLVLFWSGAGRTLGMSFVGLLVVSENGEGVAPGQAARRVIWLVISALPLMLGYWGVLFEERRRGWPDRRAGTLVLYADPDLDHPSANTQRPSG